MRTLAALAAAVAMLAPSFAGAQPVSAPSGPDTYLALHLGAFLPQHDDLDGFDTGYAFGGLFGVRFTRNLSAEAGVGYYRTKLSQSGTDLFGPYTTEQALGVVPVTVNLRVRQPFKFAEVSALAGFGIHFASLGTDYTVGGVTTSHSRLSTAFGFQVGAGAAFNVWPTTLVGVEVVRTFVGAKFEGTATRIDGLTAAATVTYRL